MTVGRFLFLFYRRQSWSYLPADIVQYPVVLLLALHVLQPQGVLDTRGLQAHHHCGVLHVQAVSGGVGQVALVEDDEDQDSAADDTDGTESLIVFLNVNPRPDQTVMMEMTGKFCSVKKKRGVSSELVSISVIL